MSYNSSYAQQRGAVVKIIKQGNGFRLHKDGQPYFIKGAVGEHYMDKLLAYGGNAIRTGSRDATIAKAQALGVSVLVNLPVRAQRDGMDYNDAKAVEAQHKKALEIVSNLKDNPAVLMWALGNELDFIQANQNEAYNLKVWAAVDALAKEIHRIDPNHPVMTVVGSIDQQKISDLIKGCPNIDLLGINEYGDLIKIPEWLNKYGWKKPYVVTEWGPTGFWQVPKTPWKVPIEETSSMKADQYKKRYEEAILADSLHCLGSYVFLWRQHQERTHTWFGMFDAHGWETEAVDVMQFEWSGKWPSNRAPRIDSMTLQGQTAYQGIRIAAGKPYNASVMVADPEGFPLAYSWEIIPEGNDFPYGGNGEKKQDPVTGLINYSNTNRIDFKAPMQKGSYRLFVYVYDSDTNWATANIPFLVE